MSLLAESAEAQIRTYLVSTPIISYYYTQLIGDAKNLPHLVATANFQGIAIIGGCTLMATLSKLKKSSRGLEQMPTQAGM